MRLIDADELWKETTGLIIKSNDYPHRDMYNSGVYSALQLINDAPTIDPVEHGRWLDTNMKGVYRCSVCNAYWSDEDVPIYFDYCPTCGAYMKGGQDDEQID